MTDTDDSEDAEAGKTAKLRYSDDELLNYVRDERMRSIGFGEGDAGVLVAEREQALRFYKGDMGKEVPSMAGRSGAVSLDVAEAVETVMPDLMEIFVGGDDIASFEPTSQQDEEQAKLETDYVNHVIHVDNEGFLAFYTAIKDALIVRTGLFYWYPETSEEEVVLAEGVPQDVADEAAQQFPEATAEPDENGTATLSKTQKKVRVCIKAVPPEDFTVAQDTISLRDATYCAMRDRPRVQDLIARGIKPSVARDLPAFGVRTDEVSFQRDEAGENSRTATGGLGDLRMVEVREHYIRLADDDDQLKIWRVLTDGTETTLLEKEQVERIPFGALTPYINAHRFYGESVADKLIEIQKIKTALLRGGLDNVYFALNQRNEVDMSGANEFTIADLLNNIPGSPVRVARGGSIQPLQAGALNVDTWAALEQVSVMGEQRSGIMRNAQGLNPDTLHDTAHGAMALLSAAQKRVRMIARVLAETGIKELYLGVHAMLRASYEGGMSTTAKLRNKWQTVEPANWSARNAMNVQVGMGASGKEHDLAAMGQILSLQEKIIQAQQGLNGPLLKPDNIYNAAKRFAEKAGQKTPELFFSDPNAPPDPHAPPPPPPKPDPEMQKAQAQAQTAQLQMQMQMQLETMKAEAKSKVDQQAMQSQFELQKMKLDGEMALKQREMDQKMDLERTRAMADLQLQREEMLATVKLKREAIRMKADASTDVDGAVEDLPG